MNALKCCQRNATAKKERRKAIIKEEGNYEDFCHDFYQNHKSFVSNLKFQGYMAQPQLEDVLYCI